MTPMERQYDAIQQTLRPYWAIEDKVWATYVEDLRSLSDFASLVGKTDKAAAYLIYSKNYGIIKANNEISYAKKQMLYQNPNMKAVYDKYKTFSY